MSELHKWAVSTILLAALCSACYLLGRAHAEVKIVREQGENIIKEAEVIKYVEKEKSQIWTKPNADRDALLELMQANKL